jgi:pyrroline-5-carboxylate reductase
MARSLAIIGVGNMAKAIIAGITKSDVLVSTFYMFDKNADTYNSLQSNDAFVYCDDVHQAVLDADCVLLSVKPQNYPEVLEQIKEVDGFDKKLYISIAAGITSQSVSDALGGATVIRVLPNLPMTIGYGVSAICKNDSAAVSDFEFVTAVFESAGSTTIIDETEMNRIIGALSSSPAYVFKFIDSICQGASAQGLDGEALLSSVCDVVIGSAMLLKNCGELPSSMISKVASKGGTTQRALDTLDEYNFNDIIEKAMIACTNRADELGKIN